MSKVLQYLGKYQSGKGKLTINLVHLSARSRHRKSGRPAKVDVGELASGSSSVTGQTGA